MIVLDENVRQDQGEQLRRWGVKARFLIEDLAPSGIKDPDIIHLLHRLRTVSFFTHDRDYFNRSLTHSAYGLFWLDVLDGEAAEYVRRLLHHADFDTHSKRMGKVVRIYPAGLRYWVRGKRGFHQAKWM